VKVENMIEAKKRN